MFRRLHPDHKSNLNRVTGALRSDPKLAEFLAELVTNSCSLERLKQGLLEEVCFKLREVMERKNIEILRDDIGITIIGEKAALSAGVSIPNKYNCNSLLTHDPHDPDPEKVLADNYFLGFDEETEEWLLVRRRPIPDSFGLSRLERVSIEQFEVEGLQTSIPASERDANICFRLFNKFAISTQEYNLTGAGEYAATDWERNEGHGNRFVYGGALEDDSVDVIVLHDHHTKMSVGAACIAR